MLKRITKISAQNFSEAVDYANALNKKRIVTIRVRKLLLPLGSFMFALHALLLSLGVLYALASETELVAFEAVGFIPGYWNGVTGLLDGITNLGYLHALLMMLYLYFVPFVVCSVAALVIARTTKATPLTVTGSTAERAKQLCLFCGKIPYAQEL
ncbi:MAG: hypothetical protein IKV55_06020, partial [Oscillospiraceae bacterium]|nr:hypothetical protein [Oscillospiraceae bacterium]